MTGRRLVFLDTETTGLEEGRLVELAFAGPCEDEFWSKRFKPPVPITFEAMATHHITEKMVDGLKPFGGTEKAILEEQLEGSILVAHNAPFDIDVLRREGVKVGEFIDTKRVAMRLLPEMTSHSLQCLRYALGLEVEAEAHSAAGDVAVLKAVFEVLLGEAKSQMLTEDDGEAVDWMVKASGEPVVLELIPFGKHRGRRWEDVAREAPDYIAWVLSKDFGEDVRHTARHWASRM